MSRWSARESGDSRTSCGRLRRSTRAEFPLVALVAVAVFGLGLSLYATSVERVLPGEDRDLAETALSRVDDRLTAAGVADPGRLARAANATPPGYEVRVTLVANGTRWTRGPPGPAGADTASRPVAVRVAPGRVHPGRLRVEVWT